MNRAQRQYIERKYGHLRKPIEDLDWLKQRIYGVEYDIAQLTAWNKNGKNDSFIEALKFALDEYNKDLERLNKNGSPSNATE